MKGILYNPKNRNHNTLNNLPQKYGGEGGGYPVGRSWPVGPGMGTNPQNPIT
jgi:hypothetical protein